MSNTVAVMEQKALAYLTALQQSDLSAVLDLFSPSAKVYSPLYGEMPASTFYPLLLADSQASQLTHFDTLCQTANRRAALYFHYQWTMRDGQQCGFHCVDILDFSPDFLIDSLRIIYDTAHTQAAFSNLPPPLKPAPAP